MSLVLTRVDNRLIHGQVVETWIPHVHADCIVVANDEVADNTMKRALMEMAVPATIQVHIVAVDSVAACLASDTCCNKKILLLFASTEDACKAFVSGARFQNLNLGNLHGGDGKVRYSCTICLDDGDIQNLQTLESQGVRVVAQCVPSDREQPLAKLCRCEVNFG